MRRLREHLSLGDECVSPFSLSLLYLIPLLMNILQSLQSGLKQTVQERKNKQEVNLLRRIRGKYIKFICSKMTGKDVIDYCREMPKLIEERDKFYKQNKKNFLLHFIF